MPLDNNPEDPDDLSYSIPTKPSELTALSDEEMFRVLHKTGFANKWPVDAKIQFEATARLIAALKDFRRSSDRASKVMIVLTILIAALTVVLVWLTASLD
jgi:hypothetical protein